MKFVLKEFSAASRVANIFGGVAVRPEMEADGAALKFRTEMRDALAVRMIEAFGDTENRSEAASKALVGIIQRAVRRMITRRFCLSIVVTNGGGDQIAVAAIESGNVAVERQIFAVLVMAAIADSVADVMEQRGGFEQDARFGRQMLEGALGKTVAIRAIEKQTLSLPLEFPSAKVEPVTATEKALGGRSVV